MAKIFLQNCQQQCLAMDSNVLGLATFNDAKQIEFYPTCLMSPKVVKENTVLSVAHCCSQQFLPQGTYNWHSFTSLCHIQWCNPIRMDLISFMSTKVSKENTVWSIAHYCCQQFLLQNCPQKWHNRDCCTCLVHIQWCNPNCQLYANVISSLVVKTVGNSKRNRQSFTCLGHIQWSDANRIDLMCFHAIQGS